MVKSKLARLIGLAGACVMIGLPAIARANTITVNSLSGVSDPTHCSLSDAVEAANTMAAVNGCAAGSGNDVINFTVAGTIGLGSAAVVENILTINGPAGGITLDGGVYGPQDLMAVAQGAVATVNRISFINQGGGEAYEAFSNGGTATLNNCTFSNNHAAGHSAQAGAIFNFDAATGPLTITNSTFANNSGPSDGAISNQSALVIVNSTFYGNRYTDIHTIQQNPQLPASAVIINSTFAGLTGPDGYSIGSFNGASTSLKGVILENTPTFANCSLAATIVDDGYNISNDNSCAFSGTSKKNTDPKLDPAGLKSNGGPTQTIALVTGSPAIDVIPQASCTDQFGNPLTQDQRGFPRPDAGDDPNGPCDIGAYESDPASPVLGGNAQLFGLLANSTIQLAGSSTIGFVNQSLSAPKVGGGTASIAGPTSYLTGDLITSGATGTAISLGTHDTAIGQCVTGGGSIALATGAACGSTDSSGTNPLLTTLSNAQSEAASFASYLGGLTTTTNLGNITLKKYQSMTVKLGAGLNVVSIGNITTAGSNSITLSAPKSAVVVVNVTGALNLGTATQVFTNSSGLNAHNVVWNIESANPTFGANVVLTGTALNEVPGTVTFGAGSVVNGAVISSGNVVANGALHLSFWPFTATIAQ